eukprot:2716648-Prymnesium_polylepis.2
MHAAVSSTRVRHTPQHRNRQSCLQDKIHLGAQRRRDACARNRIPRFETVHQQLAALERLV